jgi:Ala-tRNA(Pro) deacylase
MAMAPRVQSFLDRHGARYDVVEHPRTQSSIETAEAAHVKGDALVKGVLLEDEEGMLVAVLPSTLSVHIGHLSRDLERRLRLATEDELQAAFPDCSRGAVPPLGPAYGMRTIVDDSVAAQTDLYFEAGDHECLVHMTGEQFMALLGPAAEKAHVAAAQRRTQR